MYLHTGLFDEAQGQLCSVNHATAEKVRLSLALKRVCNAYELQSGRDSAWLA
jgi:hypothetical protein